MVAIDTATHGSWLREIMLDPHSNAPSGSETDMDEEFDEDEFGDVAQPRSLLTVD